MKMCLSIMFNTCVGDHLGAASKPNRRLTGGSGRLSLFRTIETGRNRTEPPVNRRLGFEAVPYICVLSSILKQGLANP